MFASLLRAHAYQNARRPALDLAGRQYSYEELVEMASKLAAIIAVNGSQTPAKVAVLTGRTLTSYAGILACFLAGATYIPFRSDSSLELTMKILRSLKPDLIIADQSYELLRLRWREITCPIVVPESSTASLHGFTRMIGKEAVQATAPRSPFAGSGDDIAYILHTSGSTGTPRGVQISRTSWITSFPRI